jgi:NitT/TauT family transport system ATP-binding protein
MTPAYTTTGRLLTLQNISRKLGDNQVLKNVSGQILNIHRDGVEQGQVVALLGPSGVGKTTLFRIIAGLDQPDEGTVLVGVDQKPVTRGSVGVVAQSYPLFGHRTVLSNLVLAGKLAGDSAESAKQKAMNYLKMFSLEGAEGKYPTQLSGGMRQRVAIAQQFMCSEHYILMDEPFSGLDPVAVDRVIRFINELALTHEHKTFIVVTHDVESAIQVADTIWLLGRDRNPDGTPIPGAYIQATMNLIERGLAWQSNVFDKPEFHQVAREIRNIFPRL